MEERGRGKARCAHAPARPPAAGRRQGMPQQPLLGAAQRPTAAACPVRLHPPPSLPAHRASPDRRSCRRSEASCGGSAGAPGAAPAPPSRSDTEANTASVMNTSCVRVSSRGAISRSTHGSAVGKAGSAGRCKRRHGPPRGGLQPTGRPQESNKPRACMVVQGALPTMLGIKLRQPTDKASALLRGGLRFRRARACTSCRHCSRNCSSRRSEGRVSLRVLPPP